MTNNKYPQVFILLDGIDGEILLIPLVCSMSNIRHSYSPVHKHDNVFYKHVFLNHRDTVSFLFVFFFLHKTERIQSKKGNEDIRKFQVLCSAFCISFIFVALAIFETITANEHLVHIYA